MTAALPTPVDFHLPYPGQNVAIRRPADGSSCRMPAIFHPGGHGLFIGLGGDAPAGCFPAP